MKIEFFLTDKTTGLPEILKISDESDIFSAWEKLTVKDAMNKLEFLDYCRISDKFSSEIISSKEFSSKYLEYAREKQITEDCRLDSAICEQTL